MEDEASNSDNVHPHQTLTESPRKAICPSPSSLNQGLPSRAVPSGSSEQTRNHPEAPSSEAQNSHRDPDTNATNINSSEASYSALGIETKPTQAQGDTWDDDFEDVDDEAFDPANYPGEQSEEEEEDSDEEEEEEDEESATVYIRLKDERGGENGGGEGDEAIESVEREEDGGEGEGEDIGEGMKKGNGEGSGEQDGEEKDEKRLRRQIEDQYTSNTSFSLSTPAHLMTSSSPSASASESTIVIASPEKKQDTDRNTGSRASSSEDSDDSPLAGIMPSIEQDEPTTHSTRVPSEVLVDKVSELASISNLGRETMARRALLDTSEELLPYLRGLGLPSCSEGDGLSETNAYVAGHPGGSGVRNAREGEGEQEDILAREIRTAGFPEQSEIFGFGPGTTLPTSRRRTRFASGDITGSSGTFEMSDSMSKFFEGSKSTIKSQGQTLREARVFGSSAGSDETGYNSSDSSSEERISLLQSARLELLPSATRFSRTRSTFSREERQEILENRGEIERIFRQADSRKFHTARNRTRTSGFASLLSGSYAHRRRQHSPHKGPSGISKISIQSNRRVLQTSQSRVRREGMVMQQSSTGYRARRGGRPHFGDVTGTGPSTFDYHERTRGNATGCLRPAYEEGDTTDEEEPGRILSHQRRLLIDQLSQSMDYAPQSSPDPSILPAASTRQRGNEVPSTVRELWMQFQNSDSIKALDALQAADAFPSGIGARHDSGEQSNSPAHYPPHAMEDADPTSHSHSMPNSRSSDFEGNSSPTHLTPDTQRRLDAEGCRSTESESSSDGDAHICDLLARGLPFPSLD
ncbi:hypothetical protein DL98DRAFT_523904 [Cadophora sp. DSE1049]|nr:hypothetical protein DL98DRAFT_523904 [Cadophora sp. DSE1049]